MIAHPEDKAEHERLWKPEKRRVLSKYDAGAKICPAIVPRPYQEGTYICARMVYNATRFCPSCGHEFYPSKAKPK